jgi:hypothetical protein
MSDIMMGAVSLLSSDLYYMYMYTPTSKLRIYWRAPCMGQDDLILFLLWAFLQFDHLLFHLIMEEIYDRRHVWNRMIYIFE